MIASLLAAGSQWAFSQSDVTQPGDVITASSPNSPGSEGVANAIDNQPTKYLNRDSANDALTSGFVVTPSVGLTRVTGIAMQSANDAPDRDPKSVTLEGSNADVAPAWDADTWETIVQLDNIPAWTTEFPGNDRFQTQTFTFENLKPYKHYRWVVVGTQGPSTCCMQIAEVELLGSVVPGDVTQPGDPILASSPNSPGSEGVANAIDNQPTKYLNRDSANDALPSGFVVSPSVGKTLVTGISLQSANDAPDRDPKVVTLEGSNDDAPTWDSGNWQLIARLDNIPAWTALFPGDDRFKTQTFLFDNYIPYKHYRWTVLNTQGPSTCCMQIAEVELLGTRAPVDVTQPGDTIIASSPNSPGSEGVANAIDNQPTKYLNRDSANDALPSGFVVTPSVGETTVIGLTMQSANDAPDRDPKVVTLEGSNDDAPTWDTGKWVLIARLDNIPAWTALFPGNDRFQTQEFYFPNTTAYKHYRWTVLNTQGPSTCCMQIAEVELLAVTAQADCNQAAFVTLPVETPVLEGEPATFFTVVNGPWPVQWFRNGEAIPGATQLTYTTDPITAANADDVYSVRIVDCVTSPEVKATIFTPSSIRSIGLSWQGGGANGTPTRILPTDVTGVHLQAHWNIATSASGNSSANIIDPDGNAAELVDSDGNAVTDITVAFAASGQWGAGTGNVSPTQRLLNGLIHDQPGGEPGRITFSGVPAGEHSVIAYTVGIPLQFQDEEYHVIGLTTQDIFTEQMNADQYNASPDWVRGTSTDPNARTLANYVRFDKVQPTAAGEITLEWTTTTTGFDRGVAINAVQLLLNPGDVGSPPVVVKAPSPTETIEGGTVALSVEATGSDLTYQWRKQTANLVDGGNISGATTSTLRISDFSAADVGFYSVRVANAAGSLVTPPVKVKIVAADRKMTDHLIAHFKFDETGGSTAVNSGSDAIDAQVTAGTWAAGQIGNALQFDGASTWAVVDNYTKIQEEVTVSAWVKLDGDFGYNYAIVRNAEGAFWVNGGPGPQEQFDFGLVTDGVGTYTLRVVLAVGPNTATVLDSTPFPMGSWQHVAFTADGGQIRLYRNGQLVGTTAYLDKINQPGLDWLSIGARLAGDPLGPDYSGLDTPWMLWGPIDDLAIWLHAWPASVIESIHAKGLQGSDATTAEVPVIETPPEPASLSIALQADGSVQISWTGDGQLQSAPAVTGPWEEVAGAGNPYTTTPDGTRFFRVVAP